MGTKKRYILYVAASILLILAFQSSTNRASAGPLGKRVVLDNGMTLLVSERPGVPMVVVNVLIKAGSIVEPEEKVGLANLTAELLTRGTAKRKATEISQEIEFMGSSLYVSADYDYVRANLVSLKQYLEKGLEILGDVLISPSFLPEEIERKVREIQGEIKSNEENPAWVAERKFLRTLFKNHPYGRMVEGDEESIKKITREDIVDFHSNYYLPNRVAISISGDINAQEAKSLIEKYLGGWQPRELEEKKIFPIPSLEKIISLKIDRRIKQANIILGHLGISRDNPDYYAIQVMNYILGGGGFASRLVGDIRDKGGLAYSVGSAYITRKYHGSFQVELQTKNSSAGDAVRLVLEKINRIRKDKVSEKELEDAKAYLIGNLPLRIETNKEIAQNLALLEFFELGLDYFDKYPRYIRAVSKEDVLRVAKEYLHPENYVLVVVANLKEARLDH